MKPIILASSVLATAGLLAQAQLVPFLSTPSAKRLVPPQDRSNQRQQQQAMMEQQSQQPNIQLPNDKGGSDQPPMPPSGPDQGSVILSDVMSSSRQISLFASFVRDIDSVSSRLDTEGKNTTVLAPLNTAISDLPRKPWEDPKDYETLGVNAYDGKQGEDRAHANLRRFVEAHVVPASPWKEGEKVETLGGRELWWEKQDGKSVILPGQVVIEKVQSKVTNGEIWILKDVLNYAS